MENESLDWQKLKTIGSVTYQGGGVDSRVYRVKSSTLDITAKEYEYLKNRHGLELAQEILRNYYADTQKAQSLLQKDPNPLKQSVYIEGEKYLLHYIILSQGGIMLEGNTSEFQESSDRDPILAGQAFTEGYNLQQLVILSLSKDDIAHNGSNNQQIIFSNNKSLFTQTRNSLDALFEYLNKELKTSFEPHGMNVKPFVNAREHIIEIIVTDLAADLNKYYERSPNLQALRDKYGTKTKNKFL